MIITADEARERLAEIERKFEEGRVRKIHEWQIAKLREFSNMDWSTAQDWGYEGAGGNDLFDYTPTGYEPF
jgi:hypothetical protein